MGAFYDLNGKKLKQIRSELKVRREENEALNINGGGENE